MPTSDVRSDSFPVVDGRVTYRSTPVVSNESPAQKGPPGPGPDETEDTPRVDEVVQVCTDLRSLPGPTRTRLGWQNTLPPTLSTVNRKCQGILVFYSLRPTPVLSTVVRVGRRIPFFSVRFHQVVTKLVNSDSNPRSWSRGSQGETRTTKSTRQKYLVYPVSLSGFDDPRSETRGRVFYSSGTLFPEDGPWSGFLLSCETGDGVFHGRVPTPMPRDGVYTVIDSFRSRRYLCSLVVLPMYSSVNQLHHRRSKEVVLKG